MTQAGGEQTAVYLVDLQTGEATRLTDEWPDQYGATFSPDGSHVIFHRQETSEFDPKPVLVDLDSLEFQPLDLSAWIRAWSPDGTQLLGLRGSDSAVVTIDLRGELGADAMRPLRGYTLASGDVSWQPVAP